MTRAMLLSFLFALCAAAPLQARAPASPAVVTPDAQRALADDLRRRLNSPNLAERQGAERELASVAAVLNDAELLNRVAASSADQQTRELLLQRINQLRARGTAAPVAATLTGGALPPISIKVQQASMAQVVDALNTALNTEAKITAPNVGGPFTLDVQDKPFWEVVTALQAQAPFNLGAGTRISFSSLQANLRPHAIDGPMIMYVTAVNYSRTVNLQTMPDPTPRNEFTMILLQAIDPRLPPSTFAIPTLSKVVDDLGNEFTPLPSQGTSAITGLSRSYSIPFNAPARIGKSLSFIADTALGAGPGSASPATFILAAQIDDVKKRLNESVAIPGGTFQVTQFEESNGQIRIRVALQMTTRATGVRATCALLDSAGVRIWNGNVTTSLNTVVATPNAGGPYKLEIRTAADAGEKKFRFEFKNIPLP